MTAQTFRTRILALAALALASVACERKPDEYLSLTGLLAESAEVTTHVRVDGGPPAEEVTVTLSGATDVPQETSGGSTIFSDVAPGEYILSTTPPPAALCPTLSTDLEVFAGDDITATFDCLGLPGNYTIRYVVIFQDCFEEDPASFSVGAVVTADGNFLVFTFNNTEDTVEGEVDPETGEFEGQSAEVEVQPGVVGQETWSMVFALDGAVVTFSGTSVVVFTFANGGSCTIEYDVDATEA